MPAISEGDRVVRQAVSLIEGARILGLPVLLTEQYPKGLGRTVPEVLSVCEGYPIFEKTTFSGCSEALTQILASHESRSVLVAGVETHVCVTQTVLGILESGYQVHVVGDATSSRTEANRRIGLDRMRQAGATISSVEMALFELLRESGTPEFKSILSIIK